MKIRRYESQTKLSSDPNAAIADPGAASVHGRAIADIGGALSTVAEGMMKAQEFQERTSALNKVKAGLNDVLFRASQDPDPKNTKKYMQEVMGLRNLGTEGISLRTARQNFESEYQTEANGALLKLRQMEREKTVNLGMGALLEALDQDKNAYIASGSPIEQSQILARSEYNIDNAAAVGFITPQKAFEMKKAIKTEIGMDKATSDLNAARTAEEVEAVKTALLEGAYEQNGVTMDPEKKRGILSNADSFIEKKRREAVIDQKVLQDKTEAEFAIKISNNQGSLPELQEALRAGRISLGYFETAKKAILSPEISEADKVKEYEKLLNEYNSLLNDRGSVDANFGRVAKFRQHLLEAQGRGAVLPSKATEWHKTISKTFELGLRGEFNKVNEVKKAGFNFLWMSTNRLIKDKDEQVEARAFLAEELMKRINAEEDMGKNLSPIEISDISRKILKDYIRVRYPSTLGREDVPHAVASRAGGVTQVFEGDTKIKADRSITAPKEQKVTMTDKTGKVYQIPKSLVEDAKKEGLIPAEAEDDGE